MGLLMDTYENRWWTIKGIQARNEIGKIDEFDIWQMNPQNSERLDVGVKDKAQVSGQATWAGGVISH